MKKILLVVLAITLFTISGFSQQNSLLWKVEGKKADGVSYLYGTVHVQAKEVFNFDKLIYDKIKSCDVLAVELKIDEMDHAELKEKMLMEEGNIKDYISDKEYALLDSVLKATIGQPLFLFEKMKPFFISSQLIKSAMPKEMPMALDMHLIDTARKMGIEVVALEEISDQIGAIDKMGIEEQIEMLMEDLDEQDVDEIMEEQFEMITSAYLMQDLDSISKLMEDTTLPESFADELIIKRNKGMAKEIHKIMKNNSVFAAFGAAHLPGEKGVINLLRKKGYKVKAVEINFNN